MQFFWRQYGDSESRERPCLPKNKKITTARPGDAVLVTYEGRLADGTVFDSAAQPVGLPVSDVVPGFTEALLLMNEGGRYRFRIPARLAYGAAGVPGVVPPDAELDFTLTLIRVGRPAAP